MVSCYKNRVVGNLPILIDSDILYEVLDFLVLTHFSVVLFDVLDRLMMGDDVTFAAHHLHHVLARTSNYFGQLQLREIKKLGCNCLNFHTMIAFGFKIMLEKHK